MTEYGDENYGPVLLHEVRGGVGILTLHRPASRNAINRQLIAELNAALALFESDDSVGAIVVTGGEKIFCAGADIKEMKEKSFASAYIENFVTKDWELLAACRKPVIAAVAGFAVGGGCEFAMMCDIVIADETAKFGQPEVNVGTIPGGGGTQRLARSIGKAKAMELCLSGRVIDAFEAEKAGIVSLVVAKCRHIDRRTRTKDSFKLPPDRVHDQRGDQCCVRDAACAGSAFGTAATSLYVCLVGPERGNECFR